MRQSSTMASSLCQSRFRTHELDECNPVTTSFIGKDMTRLYWITSRQKNCLDVALRSDLSSVWGLLPGPIEVPTPSSQGIISGPLLQPRYGASSRKWVATGAVQEFQPSRYYQSVSIPSIKIPAKPPGIDLHKRRLALALGGFTRKFIAILHANGAFLPYVGVVIPG